MRAEQVVVRVGDLAMVFVAADEPQADAHWRELRQTFPHAVRVEGGRDRRADARRAAAVASSERFVTVDADTRLDPAFAEHFLDDVEASSSCLIVWPNHNVVNGLRYGHGAVRSWSRRALHGDRPEAEPAELPKVRCFGTSHPNGSPLQAFRTAFREAARLAMVDAGPGGPTGGAPQLAPRNAERLAIWTSLGADVTNGLWCVYGARLACHMVLVERRLPARPDAPDWLDGLWRNHVRPRFAGGEVRCPATGYGWNQAGLRDATVELGGVLRAQAGLDTLDLDPEQSRFMKSLLADAIDPDAFTVAGDLYRDGRGLPPDPEKAALNYAIAATLGADLDEQRVALALSIASPFPPVHLAAPRERRAGRASAPSDDEHRRPRAAPEIRREN